MRPEFTLLRKRAGKKLTQEALLIEGTKTQHENFLTPTRSREPARKSVEAGAE